MRPPFSAPSSLKKTIQATSRRLSWGISRPLTMIPGKSALLDTTMRSVPSGSRTLIRWTFSVSNEASRWLPTAPVATRVLSPAA
jgi:hypothetical protein